MLYTIEEDDSPDYGALFDAKQLAASFDQNETKGTGMSNSAVYFGYAQSRLLAQHLSRKLLPGLTSKDQMYLVALSDTVASTKLDLEGNSGGLQFVNAKDPGMPISGGI